MQNQGKVLKLNATHSHTKIVLQEIRFHEFQILAEVKDTLSKKFGTLPEYMKLKLVKTKNNKKYISTFINK